MILQAMLASGQASYRYASTNVRLTTNSANAIANGPACNEYTSRTTANGLGTDLVISVYAVGNTIYAGTGGSLGGVSISTDGGSTFTNRNYVNSGLGGSFVLGVHAVGNTIYAATDGGLGISTNGGLSFSNKTIEDGLGDGYISGVCVVNDVVYAATGGGLGISADGGNSFVNKTIADGLANNALLGVTVVEGIIYAATVSGVSLSTDGGNTFSTKTTADGLGSNIVNKIYAVGSTVYAATYGGLSVSLDGGNSFVNKTTADGLGNNWVNSVFAIGSTVYAATEGGLSISTDGGESFTNYMQLNDLGSVPVACVYATDKSIYAGTRGGGLSFCPGLGSDLTPLLYARPSTLSGTSDVSVVVDVVEINAVPTSGSFTVKVTKDSRVSLTFSESATSVNNRTVQNSAWQFSETDPNYYVLTTRYSIPAYGVLSFGLTGKLTPGATSGVLAISSILLPTSLQEASQTNNADADKIDYFQQ